VDPALADEGFIYCLGSADGKHLMYIQRWATDLTSIEDLAAYLETREEIELRFTAAEATNGFLMYNFAGVDCSGCATLMEDSILNLLFMPQSDSESMLIAATVLEGTALWLRREKLIRLLTLVSAPLWLIYNVSNLAFGSALGNALAMVSIVIALARFDFKKQT
jgi:hypothetical protein